MNNFEIITRVLSQDNVDINKLKTEQTKLKTEQTKLKTETDKLKTEITSKEDGFIKLNTDALAGRRFGSETPINLEQNIVLNLFNVSSTNELYSQIRNYDNKTFVLKSNGNSFTVNGVQYTITVCNPCVGKIYNYNDIPVLCLTFLIDTFNTQTALFKFFIFANSNTEISGKLTVENITSGYREVLHGTNDTTFTLTPNTFHFWGQVPSLTLDFGSKINGVTNEYLFQFISGPTATSLTLPNSIKWANNSVPTIKPNTVYRVSILRGLASVLEFSRDMNFDFYNYLTIEALEDNLTVTFTNDIEYTIDGREWVKLNAGNETMPVEFGQILSFRGELTPNSSSGIGTFTISKKCNLKGNCMSLLFGDNAANNFSLSGKSYAFYKLFYNCTNIVNVDSNFLPATTLAFRCYLDIFNGCTSLIQAPELPATTLAGSCYYGMFRNCTSLVNAPVLPATTLAGSCYYFMFGGCTSLVNAPVLPATTLASSCYSWMFENCKSLTQVPELPATTLENSCYAYMFYGCKGLTTAPELPVTTLANRCYYGMFRYCTSLTQAPELPATTLTDSCYEQMFDNCTSFVNAPELPATTLADSCYNDMFGGCTSLVNAPALPATTLANSCYYYMFAGCDSLTTAPELPATTLANRCYERMFDNCLKLNYIKMLATDISASNCLNNWVYLVSSTGTFIKNAAMESLPTGMSGIPDGWTVQNA